MKAKSIRNVHGVLFAILQAAVDAEPPLRATNLCAKTRLPKLAGLIEGSTNGWTAVPLLLIPGGILFFAAFAYRQRTATYPLIVPSLLPAFRSSGFWLEAENAG